MGYTGKQVIHPDQVPIVQAAFSPSSTQTKWATELIEAFHRHQETGKVLELLWYCLGYGRFSDLLVGKVPLGWKVLRLNTLCFTITIAN